MDIQLKDGKSIRIMVEEKEGRYEYFAQGVKLGIYDPKVMKDPILIMQKALDQEIRDQIKDAFQNIDLKEIQEEADKTKQVKDYAEENGLGEVRDMLFVSLSEERKKEGKTTEEEGKKVEKEESVKGEEVKKPTTSQIEVKESFQLMERANDMQDIKRWLGNNIPSDFTDLVVIDSSDMPKMQDEKGERYHRNSTRYSLALVNKNKEVEPLQKYIPNLKQRSASGSNPRAEKVQVNEAGKVEEEPILSEYEIGSKIMQIDNAEMGRIELNLGQEEHGGNETMGIEARGSHTPFAIPTETRRVIGKYESNGERTVDRNLEEYKSHQEEYPDCEEELTHEDVDGDLNTSHEHKAAERIQEEYVVDENGETYTYARLATRWGKYIDGQPDEKGVKEWVERKAKEDPDKTVKEIIEDGDKEFEDPRAPEHQL